MINNRPTSSLAPVTLLVSIFLAVVIISSTPSVSQAAPCTLSSNSNVPPGSVNPSTACGVGNSGNNIGNATVNAATLSYLNSQLAGTWTTLTTLTANGTASGFSVQGINAGSGTFSIAPSLLSQHGSFVLVLKDGSKSIVPQQVGWAYFLLGGSSGTFSMWGQQNQNPVQLSHATLYASGTPTQASAPATLLLLGFGLIALAVVTRKTGLNF